MTAGPAHTGSHPEAMQRFRAQYEALTANGRGRVPDWVRERRREAIEHFENAGFPTTKQESWRFTNVDALARTAFDRAGPVDPTRRIPIEPYLIGERRSPVIAVAVNGRFDAGRSDLRGLPSGAVVWSVRDAFAAAGDVVRRPLEHPGTTAVSPFLALGAAFLDDGVFVHVPRNVVIEEPIQIVHYTEAGSEPVVVHARTLVVVEAGAQASVIETFAGTDEGVYWCNAVTDYAVGENAVVDAYRVQREGGRAYHTAVSTSRQLRNSVFALNAFAFGSVLSRVDLSAVLDGEGAEATLNGLTVIGDRQHVDYHTTIDHAQPHCNSWELFNGVFDDRARGVFTGRIIVRPGAQKTDSKQTNNNLLLSEQARADSQPQLEIYADDVKCTHGATLGPIDAKALFYLRSRGLSERAARGLLTYGFGAEILNSVSIDPLRERLDALVSQRLARGAAGAV